MLRVWSKGTEEEQPMRDLPSKQPPARLGTLSATTPRAPRTGQCTTRPWRWTHRASPLCSVPRPGAIAEGLKPVWHHWPRGEPSWLFPGPCSSSTSLGTTSRSLCANTFPGTEQPGGSPTAPPCLSGRSGSCSDHQQSPQITRPLWRVECGLALARPGSPQPWDAPQPVTQPFGERFN